MHIYYSYHGFILNEDGFATVIHVLRPVVMGYANNIGSSRDIKKQRRIDSSLHIGFVGCFSSQRWPTTAQLCRWMHAVSLGLQRIHSSVRQCWLYIKHQHVFFKHSNPLPSLVLADAVSQCAFIRPQLGFQAFCL